jgi:hypothetical protein
MTLSLLDLRRKTILWDLGALAVTLAATWLLRWSTHDLLWALWSSSLIAGLAFYLRGAMRNKSLDSTAETILTVLGVTIGFGAFAVHFGMFHYIQGSILDLLIPLEPDPGRVYIGRLTWKGARSFSFVHSILIAVTLYWPFIGTTVAHQLFSPAPNLKSENEHFQPYLFVLKLHLVMFPLAALYEYGLESFPVYVLVLFVFFTPKSLQLDRTISPRDISLARITPTRSTRQRRFDFHLPSADLYRSKSSTFLVEKSRHL